jgi:D-alanyl-lipoteichoic acid acyltransferase DltB (MBOAT superfamily)
MLTGVWHGAGWTFIAWGLFYFVLLTVEKLCGIPQRVAGSPPAAALYRVFTILCFMAGWVVFRAASITDAYRYFRIMFGLPVDDVSYPFVSETALFYITDNAFLLIICVVCSTPLIKILGERLSKTESGLRAVNAISAISLAALFLVCASYAVNGSYNPFIYFNF